MHRYLIIEDDAENARYIADGLRELRPGRGVAATACSGMAQAVGE